MDISRALRVLRVSRIFRIAVRFKSLLNLIITTINILPSVLNILALNFLFIYIFAVLANNILDEIPLGNSLI
jgi:hypothetical protein